jgi:competence protein ComEC
MPLNIISFVAGAWWLQQQAALPGRAMVAALAGAAAAVWFVRAGSPLARWARGAVLKLACFAAGFAWAALAAQVRLADALPAGWEGHDIRLEGVVASLPQSDERSVRFEFAVERVLTLNAAVPRRVVLSWWGSPAREPGGAARPELAPGERWQLTVRLRRPHGTVNPHGFDYEAWLLERNLRATGYVRARGGYQRVSPMVHKLPYWVERLRHAARAKIFAALPDAPYAGVIAALAIGDQRAIPPEQWQVYTRTGVNHLMSISGLHVTMVSGLVFALVSGLWRRSARLALALPAQRAAILAGLATAFAYALLAGYAVPAQRTVYMLAVVAAALWLGLAETASIVLAAALFVVVLLDPWAVLAPGFWLSFGAVAAIMYVSVGRIGQPHWVAAWGRVQVAVTLALLAPLLALFQQVSAVSLVANAFAIPVVGLGVVPLTLAGTVAPFDAVLQLAHLVLALCMKLLEALSNLPAAMWEQHASPPWTVVLGVAATALLLAPRGFPARWLGVAGLAPIFMAGSAPLEPGALRVAVLDVGQGVAVVVRTARHALLYDAGPSFGSRADSGSRIIVPYLRATGVRRLDGVVVSHDDDDHTGGAASVLQAVPVGWMLSSLPDLDPLPLQTERALRCYSGQRWEWDGVRFEVLHPRRESYEHPRIKDNDRSCVVRIATPGASLLLPGDIERRPEAALAAESGEALRADLLLAPHQGSKTSSQPAFVQAVRPRAVVFAVGHRNRYGHPHHEVVERYRELGARIYRTDRDGALLVDVSASGAIRITPYRAVYRRYWQTQQRENPPPDPEEL